MVQQVSEILLGRIANPDTSAIPAAIGRFGERKKQQLTSDLVAKILGGTKASQVAALASAGNPQLALQFAEKMGFFKSPLEQANTFIGTIQFANATAKGGGIREAEAILVDYRNNQAALGLPTDKVDGMIQFFDQDPAQGIEALGLMNDAFVEQGLAKSPVKDTKLGRVERGIDPETGERVFFQTGEKGEVQRLKGIIPAESEASINREVKRFEAEEKKKEALNQVRESASIVRSGIGQALKKSLEFATTGLIGGLSKAIPGTPAFDLNQILQPVRANLTFSQLNKMKQASQTGASGLGQVSERELALLGSVLASLEVGQTGELLRTNLRRLQVIFDAIILSPEASGFSGFVFDQDDFDKVEPGALYINGKTGDVVRKPTGQP